MACEEVSADVRTISRNTSIQRDDKVHSRGSLRGRTRGGREEAREGALKAIQEGLKRIEEERQRIEEERQKRLQDNRQTLINLVQKLFPSLAVLARKQAESITEPFVLQVMITKTFSVQTLEEAIQCLIEVPDAIEKHD